MSHSNIVRIVDILASFSEENEARRTADVLASCGIGRVTGYALIRAMVRAGLLTRVDHGWLRLGERARSLAFAPLHANYAARIGSNEQTLGPLQRNAHVTERNDLADELLQIIDPGRFSRPAPYRLALANASLSNPWRRAMLNSVEYAIRLNRDKVESFAVEHAGDDWRKQIAQVARMLDDRPDAILISAAPDEDGSLSALLRQAQDCGTAIIALDRRPGDRAAYTSFVTASDSEIGRISALWLGEWLKGRGRIWMLSGVQGSSPALRRQRSALEQFGGFPDIQVEAVVHTGWTSEGGSSAIHDLLRTLGSVPDGVWCDSGLQGFGSLMAFEAHGLKPPPHTGGDLNCMYKYAIDHRTPFVAVDYPAAMGALAVETTLSILRGEPVPRRVETPLKIILPRGHETPSVKADGWAERHVRWDLPDGAILSQGASMRTLSMRGESHG